MTPFLFFLFGCHVETYSRGCQRVQFAPFTVNNYAKLDHESFAVDRVKDPKQMHDRNINYSTRTTRNLGLSQQSLLTILSVRVFHDSQQHRQIDIDFASMDRPEAMPEMLRSSMQIEGSSVIAATATASVNDSVRIFAIVESNDRSIHKSYLAAWRLLDDTPPATTLVSHAEDTLMAFQEIPEASYITCQDIVVRDDLIFIFGKASQLIRQVTLVPFLDSDAGDDDLETSYPLVSSVWNDRLPSERFVFQTLVASPPEGHWICLKGSLEAFAECMALMSPRPESERNQIQQDFDSDNEDDPPEDWFYQFDDRGAGFLHPEAVTPLCSEQPVPGGWSKVQPTHTLFVADYHCLRRFQVYRSHAGDKDHESSKRIQLWHEGTYRCAGNYGGSIHDWLVDTTQGVVYTADEKRIQKFAMNFGDAPVDSVSSGWVNRLVWIDPGVQVLVEVGGFMNSSLQLLDCRSMTFTHRVKQTQSFSYATIQTLHSNRSHPLLIMGLKDSQVAIAELVSSTVGDGSDESSYELVNRLLLEPTLPPCTQGNYRLSSNLDTGRWLAYSRREGIFCFAAERSSPRSTAIE